MRGATQEGERMLAAMLAYEELNFHRMAIYGGIAILILILIARLLISRL